MRGFIILEVDSLKPSAELLASSNQGASSTSWESELKLKLACLRDMIGLSNQALSTFATSPLSAFFEARPTITVVLDGPSLKVRRKSVGVDRGVNVIDAVKLS